ncbi:rho GTPase-activating protein gacHH [Esox lucius]|uniref:rho GTPase-activating protein gacHH n=1 Tax=Esox lucius TaxID=8010 RepID=UPI001476CDC4|nr:rho GTPase-activating protein gacHH [Esox lucius]
MALASGHWVDKEMKGEPPSPRHGHAITVAGDLAFLFGGVSTRSEEMFPMFQEDSSVCMNDFYMLTVSPYHITWEVMPQNGAVPSAREGHTLCLVKGKLYLFGGVSNPQAGECLPGVYCFDIVNLEWERLTIGGVSLRTVRHCSVSMGDNIYVYGGLLDGVPTDDLMMFNTVSLNWTPVKTTGTLPSARYNHTFAAVGELVFMFGGCTEDGCYHNDVHILNTDTLVWQRYDVKGESPLACAGQTLTAHHDKDIYLFGGKCISQDGTVTSTNEINKLSIDIYIWWQK